MTQRRSYQQKPEMQWKITDEVEAARRAPGWRDFHVACHREKLLFDHIERVGRREWECVAHTCERGEQMWDFFFLGEGRGKTPIEALLDAYDKSGIVVAAAAPSIALLRGETSTSLPAPAEEAIDMEDLLG